MGGKKWKENLQNHTGKNSRLEVRHIKICPLTAISQCMPSECNYSQVSALQITVTSVFPHSIFIVVNCNYLSAW